MRTFESGATRNTDREKFDYEGYLSPDVLEVFAWYMHRHQEQADGSRRASDNWQRGMPKGEYLKSALRHVMAWWRLHRHEGDRADLVEALCGCLFNVQGYLYELLREDMDDGPDGGSDRSDHG